MPSTLSRVFTPLAALAAFLILIQGCGPVEIEGDIREVTVEVEEFVMRPTAPKVYIKPKDHPDRELTALFFPFRIQQSIENPVHYGRQIGRTFWQIWLEEQVFPVMEFYNKRPWPGGDAAVAQGRAKGADLVIGGDVTHILAGGDIGDSRLALRLEIYDVYSGALIWSMAHSGEMINRGKQDFLFFTKKSSMPNDPLYAIVCALADDMAQPVLQWMEPLREKNGPCEDCPKPEEAL